MKYIDVEFSNQPVVLPLNANSPAGGNTIQDLIRPDDVTREQRMSSVPVFLGYLIPPTNVWRALGENDANKRSTKTKILKQFTVVSRPKLKRNVHTSIRLELSVLSPSANDVDNTTSAVTEHIYLQDDRLRPNFSFVGTKNLNDVSTTVIMGLCILLNMKQISYVWRNVLG